MKISINIEEDGKATHGVFINIDKSKFEDIQGVIKTTINDLGTYLSNTYK